MPFSVGDRLRRNSQYFILDLRSRTTIFPRNANTSRYLCLAQSYYAGRQTHWQTSLRNVRPQIPYTLPGRLKRLPHQRPRLHQLLRDLRQSSRLRMLRSHLYLQRHAHKLLRERIVHLTSHTRTFLQHQREAAPFRPHSHLNEPEDRKCREANTQQIRPPTPIPRHQHTKAEARLIPAPHSIAIGAEHPEDVLSRRQIRVVSRASSRGIHPSTIEAIEQIPAVRASRIVQAQPGILEAVLTVTWAYFVSPSCWQLKPVHMRL